MPHATMENGMGEVDWEKQGADDDALMANLLGGGGGQNPGDNPLERIANIADEEFGKGEKAEDAEDFMDIDDDDLAEDLDVQNARFGASSDTLNGDGINGEDNLEGGLEDNLFEDLFGDGAGASSPPQQPSSPIAESQLAPPVLKPASGNALHLPGRNTGTSADVSKDALPRLVIAQTLPQGATPNGSQNPPSFRGVQYAQSAKATDISDEDDSPDLRLQRQLFARAGKTEASEVNEELFKILWPQFDPGETPHWYDLRPQKRAHYVEKKPPKQPKVIQPSKVSIELEPDQERNFKLPTAIPTSKRPKESSGVVVVSGGDGGQQGSDDEEDLDLASDLDEPVAGVTMQDLRILCADWEIPSAPSSPEPVQVTVQEPEEDFDDVWGHAIEEPAAKKRKTSDFDFFKSVRVLDDAFPSLDEPEAVVDRLSKKVVLDLNDPRLLIHMQKPEAEQRPAHKAGVSFRKDVSGSLTKSMANKFNISNDDEYDKLKENHQHRVRSVLGNISVEHSLPAIKLQFPFYKVKLSNREARSFHRPTLQFNTHAPVHFKPLRRRKRKEIRAKGSIQSVYEKAEDLSMNDNADMLLLEYSEEYPMMLSNFGMGNKLINYYRRKDEEDQSRPKRELGETQILQPQDKSPFSIFGTVDPGETVPTLHNGLYRAPVFQHEPKNTDFLVVRSQTGVDGATYYLQNISNLMVVGQQFPSVEVPGTHSRKVTEAAKRRLKMISYRIYGRNLALQSQTKKNMNPLLSNEMIKEHLPGTEIAANRSKMREIMAYDKDNSSWVPKRGEVVPDEETMRSWLKPEDICMLDAMQVGHRHLEDAGYSKATDEASGDENAESLEQQLAPWQLTKNFLNACQSKAMLQLHGEGDPSGRGEAFSFIKTSMKGGFRAAGESVEDKIGRRKEYGGHSYNVAAQQKMYEDSIQRIWKAQHQSLTSVEEHSDDFDMNNEDSDEEAENSFARGRSPRSEVGTPSFSARGRDDDSASQVSHGMTKKQKKQFLKVETKGKILKITRKVRDKYNSSQFLEETEIVDDPRVIRSYIRTRRQKILDNLTIDDLRPSGDPESDALLMTWGKTELTRLERNKERRHTRDQGKARAIDTASTPGTPLEGATPAKTGGTARKCANCGQVGHIKTNKQKCPLLNGSQQPGAGFGDGSFGTPQAGAMLPPAPPVQPPSAAPTPSTL